MAKTYLEKAIEHQNDQRRLAKRLLGMTDAEMSAHVAEQNSGPMSGLFGSITPESTREWARSVVDRPIDMDQARAYAEGLRNSDHDV